MWVVGITYLATTDGLIVILFGVESDKYSIMRIHEIINESSNDEIFAGNWARPIVINRQGVGEIVIIRRFDESNSYPEAIKFLFYDKRVDKKDREPEVAVVMESGGITIYHYRDYPKGKYIDEISMPPSKLDEDKITNLFYSLVNNLMNTFLGENMNKPFDIRKEMPEADEIIRQAIRSYGRHHNKETGTFDDMPLSEHSESTNMSPYKDAIKNAETPKKKSAKRKVEDLFND
jgi:hypothetical protein